MREHLQAAHVTTIHPQVGNDAKIGTDWMFIQKIERNIFGELRRRLFRSLASFFSMIVGTGLLFLDIAAAKSGGMGTASFAALWKIDLLKL